MTIPKPTFNVREEKGMKVVEVNGRIYTFQPVNSERLDLVNFGPQFRQCTYGEHFSLIHAAYLNSDNEQARQLLTAADTLGIVSDTGLYFGKDKVYAKDRVPRECFGDILFFGEKNLNPKFDERALEARLGTKEVRGVIFSDDGLVRALPRFKITPSLTQIAYPDCNAGLIRATYTADMIENSPNMVLFTGDEESPEKMAEILRIRAQQIPRSTVYMCFDNRKSSSFWTPRIKICRPEDERQHPFYFKLNQDDEMHAPNSGISFAIRDETQTQQPERRSQT